MNYEDDSENFEEIIKNQSKAYKDKKFIVGNQLDKRFYKTIEESPSNREVTKLSEEQHYTSIVAESSGVARGGLTGLLVATILRLFL